MTASASQPLTVTFTYTGTGTPPTYLDVLVSGQASATASVNGSASLSSSSLSSQASASDGLGESASAQATPSSPDGSSPPAGSAPTSGKHLLHLAVSGGKAQVSVPAQFSITLVNQVPCGTGGETSANVSTGVSATVMQDNREVSISSSLGQTSHKSTTNFDSNGVALPDPDVPGSDGTTNANSVKIAAGDQETYEYTATLAGSWAANSSYLWHSSEGEMNCPSSSGTFTMPSDPPFYYGALYKPQDIVSGREHVYIHLTDAGDGANATNNYYIQWHDPAENWQDHGPRTEIAPKLFGTSGTAQPAAGVDNVTISSDEVDWSTASHVGGGIVTTAAGVLAVAQPETSPFVIGFLTAAGYTLSLATPPNPQVYPISGPETQFTADVNTQVKINNGNTAGVFLPGSQRIDPVLATQIAASGQYHQYFTRVLGPGFVFSVQAYRHRLAENRIGDGYGTQGYYGAVYGTLTISANFEYVYNWH